jgi:hypothetical protein
MSESFADLLTQLGEPDGEESGEDESPIHYPKEHLSLNAWRAHLATKLGGTNHVDRIAPIGRSQSVDAEASGDSSPPFSFPPLPPLPISPLNPDLALSPSPPPHSPPKRRRDQMSPTPPPSPVRNPSVVISSSPRRSPPGSPAPTHSDSPEAFIERCLERYHNNHDLLEPEPSWEVPPTTHSLTLCSPISFTVLQSTTQRLPLPPSNHPIETQRILQGRLLQGLGKRIGCCSLDQQCWIRPSPPTTRRQLLPGGLSRCPSLRPGFLTLLLLQDGLRSREERNGFSPNQGWASQEPSLSTPLSSSWSKEARN